VEWSQATGTTLADNAAVTSDIAKPLVCVSSGCGKEW